jgi:hypothetical protein
MQRNDFLLPDELGWECNDEISNAIDLWAKDCDRADPERTDSKMLWGVAKAQLMDNIYAIIKKYQGAKK